MGLKVPPGRADRVHVVNHSFLSDQSIVIPSYIRPG